MPSELKPCPHETTSWNPWAKVNTCDKCFVIVDRPEPATPIEITEAQSESLHKAMLASLDMEPLGEAFERVWDANTDKLYEIEPATPAGDDALVDHAKSDLRYVEGLECHLDEGGTASSSNTRDLIAMVRWNAEHFIASVDKTAAAHAAGEAKGRAEERADVVVWLGGAGKSKTSGKYREYIIRCLKRGQHERPKP